MRKPSRLSRRKFVGSTLSLAAALPLRSLAQSAHPEQTSGSNWSQQGILAIDKSPFAKLHNVPVHAVTITQGFWAARRETNASRSIPSMEKLLEANGRRENFLRLAGKSSAPQTGPVYSDSDVYKWIEAAGFALQSGRSDQLRARTDSLIKDIVAVQQPNGYLNTYFVADRAGKRMEPETQRWGHELYNIGHLIQGAIAYYRATGDRTLLNAGIRFVHDFLLPQFGPDAGKKPLFSGHPEMELALIELYRTTGDKRHLDLAGYLLRGDDRIKFPKNAYVYHFCGIPFTSRTHLEGHAVRAMYACCGATDYYLESGDESYRKTLDVLWNDLHSSQMYITGGVGARSDGEAFGDSYELPNFTAYGESCAAIGNMMWNWRMLAATGEAKYADVIECALYNGINSGMSLDGALYCYRNPLSFDPAGGEQIRNPWYDTTCCPPNLERTFASLPGYLYSSSKDGIYLHLYENSQLDWKLENGVAIKIAQATNYPWDGSIAIRVAPESPAEFTFYLRIPGWSGNSEVSVNGKARTGVTAGEYLPLRRRWSAGDEVRVNLEMKPRVIQANRRIVDDYGRVAVRRGPLVYCLEQLDQPPGVALFDVSLDLEKLSAAAFVEEFRSDLLGGVLTLRHAGICAEASADDRPLYREYSSASQKIRRVDLRFIPYYAWANRAPTPMQVWTPVYRA